MKKVIILELAGHFEVARSYAHLFYHAGYTVTIGLQGKYKSFVHQSLPFVAENHWHILEEGLSLRDYIQKILPVIDEQDLVLVCTHEAKKGVLIHKQWKTQSALVIHDANNYFDPWSNLDWAGGPLAWAKILKYVYNGYFKKRRTSALDYDRLILPVPITTSLQKKCFHPSLTYLPFLWNEEVAQRSKTGQFHVVIPGTVNMRSRDYDFVMEVFEHLIKQDLHTDLTLTLLGKIQGKKEAAIARALLSKQNTRFKVNVFERLVDQPTFDAAMKSADLLFLPLQKEWVYGVVREIGGETCLSGNVGDMVRYGAPALLPESYALPSELEALVLRYPQAKADAASKAIQDCIQKKQGGTNHQSIINTMIACNETQLNRLAALR